MGTFFLPRSLFSSRVRDMKRCERQEWSSLDVKGHMGIGDSDCTIDRASVSQRSVQQRQFSCLPVVGATRTS